MDASDSDDDIGWGALHEGEASPDPVQSQNSTPARNDDEDILGWDEVIRDDISDWQSQASAPKSVSDSAIASASHKNSSVKRRGRPPGIKGSRQYRAMMRGLLKQDEPSEADSGKASMTVHERMAHARQALQLKRKASVDSLSDKGGSQDLFSGEPAAVMPTNFKPANDIELQATVSATALALLAQKNRETVSDSYGHDAQVNIQPNFDLQSFVNNLFAATMPHRQHGKEDRDSAIQHIFMPYRGYSSITRDADSFGLTFWSFAHTLIRAASSVRLLHYKMWSDLLKEVHRMTEEEKTHSGEMVVVRLRFDETPTKIRVSDLETFSLPTGSTSTPAKSTQPSKQLAKILQSEVSLAFMLKSIATGKQVLLTGSIPVPLQVLDRQTARNLKQALEASLKIVGLDHLCEGFKTKLFLCCADEFSSNDLAQWSLQACRNNWLRVSTLCDIHKGSTVQGRVFDLTGPGISAIINLALSMTAAGSVSKLQKCLAEILSSKFELRIGSPTLLPEAVEYKKQILDLYLGIPDRSTLNISDAVSSKTRLRFSQRMKQRCIIEHFFNDDLRNGEKIVHWAHPGQYVDSNQALAIFLKYVVPALIPCSCPLFPRSRWFGADQALDYVGLWASVHGLLTPLVLSWCGKDYNSNSISAADPTTLALDNAVGDRDDDEGGWDFSVANDPGRNFSQANEDIDVDDNKDKAGDGDHNGPLLAAACDNGGDGALGNQGESSENFAEKSPDFDWHSYHQRLRTSVLDWVLRKGVGISGPSPQTQVALMRQYMEPILRLMAKLLYVSSKRWARDQLSKESRGQPREYRVLLAFQQEQANTVLQAVATLMQRPPVAVPQDDWRSDISVLCFTMLSRLSCSLYQLLVWRCKKYPYALFQSLLGEEKCRSVYQEKRCLQDELTQHLVDLCGSEQAFCSNDSISAIKALAMLVETDIGAIERQHTISRRIIVSRSSSKPVSLDLLSADWLLRRSIQNTTDACSYLYFDTDAVIQKLKLRRRRNANPKRERKKKRGGGGAFRAYLSMESKGHKATADSWKELAHKYRQLSQEEKARYAEIGKAASATHKRGFHAFGPRASRKKKTNTSPVSFAFLESAQASVSALADRDMANSGSSAHSLQVVPAEQEETSLLLRNPENHLRERLCEAGAVARQLRQQTNARRESTLGAICEYLNGKSTLGPAPTSDSFPSTSSFCPGQSSVGASLMLPKPFTFPWAEWVPPAEAFAQATVLFSKN